MPIQFCNQISEQTVVYIWGITENTEELLHLSSNLPTLPNIYTNEKRWREQLAARALVSHACKELGLPVTDIRKDEFGKPWLVGSDWHFSISHTERFIAIVLDANNPIGIDLEKPSPKVTKVLARICSEQELNNVKHSTFEHCILWSAKEALYKLYGKRKVDFKQHLQITRTRDQWFGKIQVDDQETTTHRLYVHHWMETYCLVVAYGLI
ncbi:MAG: 4'-phosphopantetheinyl transferase family protein [Spirosomataceae bacterium]